MKDYTPKESYTSVTEEGKINLTTHELIEGMFTLQEEEELYNQVKDCYTYIKCVEELNNINLNPVLKNSLKGDPSKISVFETPFFDTVAIYESEKDNEELKKKRKKTKLLSDKVQPQTEYVKQTSLIELAIKNFKLIPKDTQRQILVLVMSTIDTYKQCVSATGLIGYVG